jgi:hypothetical protein
MTSAITAVKVPEDQAIATPYQFTALFDAAVFSFTLEADTIPIDAGGGETQEAVFVITVPGVALGDFVFISPGVDVVDLSLVAYVTAADTVTLQIENLTGADGTPFDTATAGFLGLVLRIKANALVDLKD